MQIKVKDTRMHSITHRMFDTKYPDAHSINQEVPVAEGKFVLINQNRISITGNELVKLSNGDWYNGPVPHMSGNVYKPIIISETERIEAGDVAYHPSYNNGKLIIVTTETEEDVLSDGGFKVIVLSEHFSPKILQQIVDGILKDGDKILLELDEIV